MISRKFTSVVAALGLVGALGGGIGAPADAAVKQVVAVRAVSVPATADSAYVSAKTLLSKLAVRAENHYHDYTDASRAHFSYDNDYDADGDGCYTRREVLKRDAIHIARISSSCAIYGGRWRSLYDNRYTDDRGTLEIDHLVPLAEAWYSGADAWSHRRQIAFGNDIDYKWDLQAVTSSLNRLKLAGDPAEWLPPTNKCIYVKAWIGVKYRWNLPVDPAEKAALVRQLAKCSSLQVLKPGKPNITKLVGHGEVEPIK
ncbi:HNH endonuclease family protein [uncultured Amnibacterium sp.]|uniref:HNH endonuclease family protein n=1 Tax=uncultured Amnibacterium sp. TaxID=1631851 RepID=UPI0035CA911A